MEENFVRSVKKEFTDEEKARLKVNNDLVDKIQAEINNNEQNSPNLVNLFNFINRSLKDHYVSYLDTKVYVKEKESDTRYYKNFLVKKIKEISSSQKEQFVNYFSVTYDRVAKQFFNSDK